MQSQLRDMEYFAAIAEHGQVQRAAAALGLSQPALSKSLRRLEQTLKTKLLKRTPKGVELTSVGSTLLAHVRKLRLSVEDISREVADLSQGRAGHLSIGTGAGFALNFVPTACNALLKEAPKVTLKITVDERNAVLSAVRNGALDLAVFTIRAPRHEALAEEHLFDEPYVVYASTNHRLAKRKQLSLADLVHERWAFSAINIPSVWQVNQAFADAGLPPPIIAVESAFLPLKFHLLAASDMLAFGSRRAVRYAAARFPIVELPVQGLDYTRRAGVVYRKDAYLSPAARRFIEILKATAKKIAAERP